MRILKFVFLLCLSLASTAHAAGFTDHTGLRWELPPNPTQRIQAQYTSDLCRKVSIGGKPGRLPTNYEVAEVEKNGENKMNAAQKADFETTRFAAGQNWPTAEFMVVVQPSSGGFWSYGLRNKQYNVPISDDGYGQIVICVGKAATKSAEKKEEPKSTTKSSTKPLGPILTKSTSGAKTPEQIAEQKAAKKANDKAAAKANAADIVEENPYERYASSPNSWGHATNGWHVSQRWGKTRESACSAAIAAQSKWIASDEDKGFMKAAERSGCICGTYTKMGNATFSQPQWTCGSYHKMKDTGKERGTVSR